jgi:hypothetical protein
MDDDLRALERAAAYGDPDAEARLEHARMRAGLVAPPPPQPTELALDKATIYSENSFGMGYSKHEVRALKIHAAPYAQYSSAIHVQFVPKGARRGRSFTQTYKPTLVVLDGWGHTLAPPSMFGTPEVSPRGLVVRQGRHSGFSDEWGNEFRAQLAAYLESNPGARLMADYHGFNTHQRLHRFHVEYANAVGGVRNEYFVSMEDAEARTIDLAESGQATWIDVTDLSNPVLGRVRVFEGGRWRVNPGGRANPCPYLQRFERGARSNPRGSAHRFDPSAMGAAKRLAAQYSGVPVFVGPSGMEFRVVGEGEAERLTEAIDAEIMGRFQNGQVSYGEGDEPGYWSVHAWPDYANT